MRRMFSEKQIKEMISAGAQSEIAEALEGDIHIGGDLSVTGSINGEENPSVKPIYCHPLGLYVSGTFRATCLIFDNSSTPFTWDTFKAWIKERGSADQLIKVMASGCLIDSGDTFVNSYIASDGTDIYLIASNKDNLSAVKTITNLVVELQDGPNQIN